MASPSNSKVEEALSPGACKASGSNMATAGVQDEELARKLAMASEHRYPLRFSRASRANKVHFCLLL